MQGQICDTKSVVRAGALARYGMLVVVFGIGVFTGRRFDARADTADARLPVMGREESGSAVAPPGPLDVRANLRKAEPASQPGAGPPRPGARAWSDVATHAQRATVGILAGDRYGAGIIVDRAGLVLTNLHVIQGIERISALLFGGETVPVSVVARAADLDLALLQLSKSAPDSAELGSSGAVRVGDDVLAVGSPRKMYFSVSRGMVSYLNRKLDKVSYIQTDLPINAGNSGGPLLDRDGRVIGVVSFILRDSQGLAFALPIDYAKERFAEQLGHSLPVARAGISTGISQGANSAAGSATGGSATGSFTGGSFMGGSFMGNGGALPRAAFTSSAAITSN